MFLTNDGNTINIIDQPLNADDLIREKNKFEVIDEEPFYVCNVSDIIEKYRIWQRSMSRIIPFYAVKCNDSPIVLQTLAALGACFDCASKEEINKVLDYGVSTHSIIYANPTKPSSHIRFAAETNIKRMTVDNDFELIKIAKIFPNAELVLRIRCDAKEAQCPLGDKFGCDPKLEAPKLIQLAKKLGLNMIGISFHVGSGCMDYPVYGKAIYAARQLFDFALENGFEFHFLDIGGGFPGDNDTSIEPVAELINKHLAIHFPTNDVTVIAEPGRFFVASAYTLATRIHSKRNVIRNGNLENVMYFINDGVYGSFNCNIYDHKVVRPKLLKEVSDKKFKSSIWGPTCDALDQVCENILLPLLDVDDIIIFENMGAYTIPIASPFNGFPLPKIEYYIERKHLEDINSATAQHEYILLKGE